MTDENFRCREFIVDKKSEDIEPCCLLAEIEVVGLVKCISEEMISNQIPLDSKDLKPDILAGIKIKRKGYIRLRVFRRIVQLILDWRGRWIGIVAFIQLNIIQV